MLRVTSLFLVSLLGVLGRPAPLLGETIRSQKYPVEVSYAQAAQGELALSILAAAEEAWAFQVVSLGYPAPAPPQGSALYELIVEDDATSQKYGAYASAIGPAVDRRWGYTSEIVVGTKEDPKLMPIGIAHEFQHALQIGICKAANNITEASAVYISGLQRPQDTTQMGDFAGFNAYQAHPERSLDWQGELGDPYPYGGAVFLMFLEQVFGTGQDGRFVAKLWNALGQITDPGTSRFYPKYPHYFDALASLVDFDDAFKKFCRWRYFFGPNDDGRHFQNLAAWRGNGTLDPLALVADLDAGRLPVGPSTPAVLPMPYGAVFVRVDLQGLAADEGLHLEFAGQSTTRWSVETILLRDGAAPDEGDAPVPRDGHLALDIPARNARTLVLAFANLGDGAYRPEGSGWNANAFTYRLSRVAAPIVEPPDPPDLQPTDGGAAGGGCSAAGARPSVAHGAPLWMLVAAGAMLARRRRAPRRRGLLATLLVLPFLASSGCGQSAGPAAVDSGVAADLGGVEGPQRDQASLPDRPPAEPDAGGISFETCTATKDCPLGTVCIPSVNPDSTRGLCVDECSKAGEACPSVGGDTFRQCVDIGDASGQVSDRACIWICEGIGTHACPNDQDFVCTAPDPTAPSVKICMLVDPIPGTWVPLTAGAFTMGSPADEPCREQNAPNTLAKETQHEVTLTRAFEIMAREVSQGDYKTMTGNNPSAHPKCGGTCPVEQVTWYQAAAYCNALSAARGLSPCYSCSTSDGDTTCTEAADYAGANVYRCPGYRLPTEAEWEYAYRAGTQTAFYLGPIIVCEDSDPIADKIGWYEKNDGYTPHPGGQKAPNAWGLYDLAGNVWEWCHDGFVEGLGAAAVTDPVTAPTVAERMARGGAYGAMPIRMRGADREHAPPYGFRYDVGFRCVRSL